MKVERLTHHALDEPVPDALKRFATEFDDEAQVVYQLDQDHFWGQMRRFLELKIGYLGLIPDVAIAGALVAPDLFGPQLEVVELFWFVRKEHRASGAGMALLHDIEAWGRENGARRISMVGLEKMAIDKVGALYEAHGYRPVQRSWAKDL